MQSHEILRYDTNDACGQVCSSLESPTPTLMYLAILPKHFLVCGGSNILIFLKIILDSKFIKLSQNFFNWLSLNDSTLYIYIILIKLGI